MEEKLLKECIAYLRERPVYHKLLLELRKKYISLGGARGRIVLKNISREEKEQMQGLLTKMNPFEKGEITVTSAEFEQALFDSRFHGITLKELIQEYFKESLQTREEKQQKDRMEWETFFGRILLEVPEGEFGEWLNYVLSEKKNAFAFIKKKYGESQRVLEENLTMVRKAAALLPGSEERLLRLPVFAAKVSGNPHYFDIGTDGEKLLSYFLKYKMELLGKDSAFLTEVVWERFYRAGILKDDLSNFVLAYGISCRYPDGHLHEGVKGYEKEHQPVHLSLLTLGQTASVSVQGEAVYVVENPAVFADLIETGGKEAAVCTSGQLCLAALVLLDKLAEAGCKLCYAGDFDPEGLQIADKLKTRYGSGMKLWLYGRKEYEMALSEVVLPRERLKKLENLRDEELRAMASWIMEEKRAGYQENLFIGRAGGR